MKDEILIRRLNESDKTAFEALYDRYVGMVYNFLNSVLKNQSLAEDYTQWCFMQLWEHRVSISSTRNLPAWLYVTARNAALKEARRQLTIARYVEYSVNFKDRVDSQRNPDSDLAVIQSEMSKVIEKLPESRRQIFLMRTVQGKSVSAIAEELGISPKTVETQIARAKEALRKHASELLFIAFMVSFGI